MWCVLYHWFQFSDSKPFLRYISRYISDFYHVISIAMCASPKLLPAKKGAVIEWNFLATHSRPELTILSMRMLSNTTAVSIGWLLVRTMLSHCSSKIAATVACFSALRLTRLDRESLSKFNSPNQSFWVKQRRGADSMCLQWVCWQWSEKWPVFARY